VFHGELAADAADVRGVLRGTRCCRVRGAVGLEIFDWLCETRFGEVQERRARIILEWYCTQSRREWTSIGSTGKGRRESGPVAGRGESGYDRHEDTVRVLLAHPRVNVLQSPKFSGFPAFCNV
jgi:hypothetical protein